MFLAVPSALSILVGRAQSRGLVLPSPLWQPSLTLVESWTSVFVVQPWWALSLCLHVTIFIYWICMALDPKTRFYPVATFQSSHVFSWTLSGACSTHCIWVLHLAFLWGCHIFEESIKFKLGEKTHPTTLTYYPSKVSFIKTLFSTKRQLNNQNPESEKFPLLTPSHIFVGGEAMFPPSRHLLGGH